ncbi:sigma-70 family RNA polymerase sigma factor [Mucilaginibacter robiniae]|uniref:Sigma-70 family RNA polymerase sigma factor n=1 Tax=Mucilaginibacter robiniae TaxID=2728022 RepID=A0A7L5E216_9SPHI|nr:sigma-70 family RNA polymerase sigma factor [Mucilaginibacter robiniae]QJD97400.1 sigma-70 family RNA polymerase sigma factor [Mucilaginibacter robiniae]
MKLNIDSSGPLSQNDVLVIRALYYRYSSWLLGYLVEVVKDYKLAEDYLVEIFKEVPLRLSDFTKTDMTPWLQLQQLARIKLSSFARSKRLFEKQADMHMAERIQLDRYISIMTTEQQLVFCGIYYFQQPTAMLASELNKSDEDVKRILKEAFTIIRHG